MCLFPFMLRHMESLLAQATTHVGDIVRKAIRLEQNQGVLVVYDRDCPLAALLTDAYRAALPEAQFLDFNAVPPARVIASMYRCAPGDLVVCIQSSNFRLNEFRVRIELFKRGLKAIEHTHMNRIPPEQVARYIAALAYDPDYLLPLGHALKGRLDRCSHARVRCKDTELVYQTGMESAKLNVGDYTRMKNVGGTFPIGEVFTEPKDFSRVNGAVRIFAFAGEDHLVRMVEPFILQIERGIATHWPGAPAEFCAVMETVRAEETAYVREFGLGLNRAMDKAHVVSDITAYERMNGMHLSLGAKHTIYAKPGLSRKHGRYHIDVFVDAQEIFLDDECIFRQGTYVMPARTHEVLGVRMHDISPLALRAQLQTWLDGNTPRVIVTPNPEFILHARRDPAFLALLNRADLAVPDGIGLIYAVAALSGAHVQYRQTGVQVLEELAALCAKKWKSLLLFGGAHGSAEAAATALRQRWSYQNIHAYEPGMVSVTAQGLDIAQADVHAVRLHAPDVIAVALGQGKQERFIFEHLPFLPSVRIAIGIGGAMEMIAGRLPRAPEPWRRAGFEWLWRLRLEPWRVRRIFRATIIFPLVIAWVTLKQSRFLRALKALRSLKY